MNTMDLVATLLVVIALANLALVAIVGTAIAELGRRNNN